uniref:Uncharacterized protein n=1 Tax=Tanacetum cinerariifolium TaxID=118510 RepID=A0A6L2NW33_TANCI|nr:hypothetical protein [Tanacetum cinerariifolium]
MKVIITEDSLRSDLRLDDAEGTACLLNKEIFEGLASMGTMASAIICLADNQKFNFSKYIFDNMVKSLEGGVKFYLFSRFLQVFLDEQVKGMERHKELNITSSHTKKIFANMRRIGTGFSGLKPIKHPLLIHHPLLNPRRNKSPGGNRGRRHSLQEQVIDLQEVKAAQAKKILSLKKKVSKLNKWKKSRSGGLRRLKKFDSVRRVKSPMEKDGLGAQEDASKQGRMIKEIDQNAEIALDDETQGRTNNDEMFGVDDLVGEEVVMETIIGVKDSAAPTTYVTEDEITMAQALAALKSVKPKVVVQEQEMSTTIPGAATKVTTAIPTPRAKAMMDDRLLAERLQAREREEFSKVQKTRLLVELIEKRKKHFAALRAQEKRDKSPTKTQMKSQMPTDMRKVNDFVAMDAEAQKSNENVEPAIDDSEELRKCIEVALDDSDEVLIKATPISSRSPTIIDYKIHKEGKKTYFKIIRANGNSQVYQTFEKMFKNFNREDLEVLWAIVKYKLKREKPVDDMDNILFRTLTIMFEHHVEDRIWKCQQGLAKVKNWKLFESC